MAKTERPVCGRCVHYRVTHDPRFPHGCEKFGIKSPGPPAVEVERTSGRPCLAFEERPPPAPRRPAR